MQCVTLTSPANCGGATVLEPQDPSRPQILFSVEGHDIVAAVRLERTIGGVDCAERPDMCGIVVQSLTGGRLHTQPLQFG